MPYKTLSGGLPLKVPTDGTRGYGSTMETETYRKIVDHDHTSGKGSSIGTTAITNGAITSSKLAAAVLQALIPVGTCLDYAGASAPSGFLLCDGSPIDRTTYSALFDVIGETYGAGDGSTTFNLPDFRGRFTLTKAASGTGDALGDTGGSLDHTHDTPAHYHGMGVGADLAISSSGSHLHTIDHNHSAFTSGAGSAHNHGVTDPLHSHTQVVSTTGSGGTAVRADYAADVPGENGAQFSQGVSTGTNSTGITINNESAHTHSIDVPNFTGNSGSTSHTHSSGDITGRIGLVTGGEDGNSDLETSASNPAFLVTNKIIKF